MLVTLLQREKRLEVVPQAVVVVITLLAAMTSATYFMARAS